MGRAARRGKTGFTGQILQTWRAVYACLPRPPTAQASINAAAAPRVATASGDRLKRVTSPKNCCRCTAKNMAFYETPRRNASDGSGASNRSTNRGHRREHSDPCPLPSPGLPQSQLYLMVATNEKR